MKTFKDMGRILLRNSLSRRNVQKTKREVRRRGNSKNSEHRPRRKKIELKTYRVEERVWAQKEESREKVRKTERERKRETRVERKKRRKEKGKDRENRREGNGGRRWWRTVVERSV